MLVFFRKFQNAAPRNLYQKSVQLYGCYNNKCCTELLENRASFLCLLYPLFCALNAPRKSCHALKCMLYLAVRTAVLLLLYGLSNPYCTASTRLLFPFLEICAQKFVVRPSRNPYGTTLTLSNTLLDFCATRLPWESCSYSSNFSFFLKLDLSLALSTRMNEQPKNGCAPLP
jgi:hypothetical protein